MEIEQAIGEELKACRQKKQISQEQLGFDADVHRTYVSLIERGDRSPTLAGLFRLCKALDTSPAKSGQTLRYILTRLPERITTDIRRDAKIRWVVRDFSGDRRRPIATGRPLEAMVLCLNRIENALRLPPSLWDTL